MQFSCSPPACPAQELLYPDYWFAYNTPELNRPISNEPDIYENDVKALPLPNGNTFVLYVDSRYSNCYQIINRYGELVFPEPQELHPVLLSPWAGAALIIPDDAGGVFAVWRIIMPDSMIGIWAQRIDSLGNRLWGDSAVQVSHRIGSFFGMSTDGMGGFLVAIGEFDDDAVRAFRLDGSGQPLWSENGVTVCDQQDQQDHPNITHDGSGGAYVVWNDYRPPYQFPTGSVWMQHVAADGYTTWPYNGVLLSEGATWLNEMFPDGEGGFLIHYGGGEANVVKRIDSDAHVHWSLIGVSSWEGASMVPADQGIYYIGFHYNNVPRVQKLDVQGNTYWPTFGSLEGAAMAILPGGMGSEAYCYGNSHFYGIFRVDDIWIYAQKMDQDANRCWGDEGIIMCHHNDSLIYGLQQFNCVPDDNGGLIGVYVYYGAPANFDVYAKHCFSDGTLGGPKPVKVIPPTRAQISSVSNREIRLELPEAGLIQLDIYNLLGRRIRSITEGHFNAGTQTVHFDDRGLAAGVYFIRLKADYGQVVRKMVVVR